MPGHQLRQEERPPEVDAHHGVEAGLRGLEQVETLARRHAGVVHQQVRVAEGRQRLLHEAGPVIGAGHVGLDDQRGAAARADGVGTVRRRVGIAVVVDRDAEAGAAQRDGDRAPDAATAAGHDGRASVGVLPGTHRHRPPAAGPGRARAGRSKNTG